MQVHFATISLLLSYGMISILLTLMAVIGNLHSEGSYPQQTAFQFERFTCTTSPQDRQQPLRASTSKLSNLAWAVA